MPVIHETIPTQGPGIVPIEPKPPASAKPLRGDGLPRILFVHDYDPVSRQVQGELRAGGYPVAWIGSGDEIGAGVAFRPDVIVGHVDALEGRIGEVFAALDDECAMVVIKPSGFNPRRIEPVHVRGSHRVLGVLDHAHKIEALTDLLIDVGTRRQDDTTLERSMLDALAEGDCLLGNLHYDFLPKIDLRRGTIAGYEALARLRNLPQVDPELLFTSVMDLRLEIAASLRAVRAALTLWHSLVIEQRSAAVAVNCSQTVLADQGFQTALRNEVVQRGVPVGMLIIEITEDARPVPIGDLVTDMIAMREVGIRFSLDDFGKGATNFDRVFSLPVSEVKIDRGFFRQCVEYADRLDILQQVIRSCRTRGVQTVIEGVETEDDLDVARSLGATLAQGFYWGRPMPAGTFAHIRSS